METVFNFMESVLFGIEDPNGTEKKKENKDLESGTKKEEVKINPLDEQKKIWNDDITKDLSPERTAKVNQALYSYIQRDRPERNTPMNIKQLKTFLFKKVKILPPFPAKMHANVDLDNPLFCTVRGTARLESTDLMSGKECSFGGVEIESIIPETDDSIFLLDFEIENVLSNISIPLEFKLNCNCDENTEWLSCSMIDLKLPKLEDDKEQEFTSTGISMYRSLLNGIECDNGMRFIRDDIWAYFLGDLKEGDITSLFQFEDLKSNQLNRSTKLPAEQHTRFCYIENTLEITIALIYIRDIYVFAQPKLSKNIDVCISKAVTDYYRIEETLGNQILEIIKFNLRKNARNSLSIRVRTFEHAIKTKNNNLSAQIKEKKIAEVKYRLTYRRLDSPKVLSTWLGKIAPQAAINVIQE